MRRLDLLNGNLRVARTMWGLKRGHFALEMLKMYSRQYRFSLLLGDLLFLGQSWYVTHVGLIRLSCRRRCCGIEVHPVDALCDSKQSRYAFRATVYTTRGCMGFAGYGDADPSNVSPLMHGAELRIAETRAVNRALRKAYGIGICSAEELGAISASVAPRKIPPQPANGFSKTSPRVRDRLCQLIRQHQLDPNLVKSYAIDYCGTNALRDATREQLESFVTQLTDRAVRDRDALVCQLNSYMENKAGAA